MKVAVYTIKGGVGKTAVLMGIGFALALLHNKKVLFVDTDMQGDLTYRLIGNAISTYSVSSNTNYGMAKFASSPDAEFRAVQLLDNIYLVPMEYDAFLNVDQQTIMRRISDIPDKDYDIVLIDTPPSFDRNSAIELFSGIDAFFSVVAPAYPSIRIINAELRLIIPSLVKKLRNSPYFIGIIKNNLYSTNSAEMGSAILALNEVCDTMQDVPHFKPCLFTNHVARRQSVFNYDTISYNIYTKNTKRLSTIVSSSNLDKVTEEFIYRLPKTGE